MDAGIIAMAKNCYRFLKKMLELNDERKDLHKMEKAAKMQAGTRGLNEGHAFHIADVMEILNKVWKEITLEKVKTCRKKTTLVTFETPSDSTVIDADDNNEVITKIEAASIIF
jgi:hypothetical protein